MSNYIIQTFNKQHQMSWVSGKQSYKSAGEHPAWCDGDMIQKN